MVLARGPREMGVTGTGTFEELFGYAWLAVLDRKARRLRLFQAQAGGAPWPLGGDPTGAEWAEVSVPDLPHPANEVRHLALAFDQAARHVVAYEYRGEVWVRQWEAVSQSYVMRGPWPGVDPVLVMDAAANYYVPDSDVLLFHLSQDRRTLVMRVQRELYETKHVVQTFDRDVILDQVLALPYQIEVVGAIADDPDQPGVVVRSDVYPIRGKDTLGHATAGIPVAGTYHAVVVLQTLPSDTLGSASAQGPGAGDYHPVVVSQTLPTDTLGNANAQGPGAGNYYAVVVSETLTTDTLGNANAQGPGAGNYLLVVVSQTLPTDTLGNANAQGPTAGSYV